MLNPSKPKVSLKDIAQSAGVSVMAVSLALRGSKNVSEETRQRIRKIAKDMGYAPNPLVSTVMSKLRSKEASTFRGTIGFVNAYPNKSAWGVSDVRTRFYSGVEKRATELGYKLEEFYVKSTPAAGARVSDILKRKSITGLIVGGLPKARGHLSLRWQQFTAATHGYALVHPNIHRVCSNHASGMILTLRKLKNLGYRKIGLLLPEHSLPSTNRLYHSVFQNYTNPIFKKSLLIVQKYSHSEIKSWIEENQLEVVIGIHHGAIKHIQAAGYKVPDDIGFTALTTDPKGDITGVDQKYEVMGSYIVEMVAGQIHSNSRGIPENPVVVMVEGEWIEGKTLRKR